MHWASVKIISCQWICSFGEEAARMKLNSSLGKATKQGSKANEQSKATKQGTKQGNKTVKHVIHIFGLQR